MSSLVPAFLASRRGVDRPVAASQSVASPKPPARFFAVALLIIVAGFCAASGLTLYDLRRNTWDQAVTNETNLLNALSQDISRNIEIYDLSLQAVVDGLADPNLANLAPDLQRRLLYDRSASAKDLGSILVLDRDGKVVRGSIESAIGADLGDREYFQAQKADPGRGLFISAPFIRRVTGSDPVIALSRSLRGPDGAFDGVVVGTMRLAYFRALFSRSDLGPKGAINLLRTDGTSLMRIPYDASQLGTSFAKSANFAKFLKAPSGTFAGKAAIDGVRRIYSFAHVQGLPLILTVAFAESDVFAVWWTQTMVIALALLTLSGTAAALGFKLKRQLDLTTRTEKRLSRSEAQYRLLADHAQDVIIRLDRSLRRTYVSPAIRTLLDYLPEELLGSTVEKIIHPDDWPDVTRLIRAAQNQQANTEAVYRLRHKAGHYVWVEGRYSVVREDGGFIVVLRDVTKRKADEAQLARLNAELTEMASTDALTGLANRRRFDIVLETEWGRAKRDGGPMSVLLLDVDRFKAFNDQYGHQAGDFCLRSVATAMAKAILRPGDLTARYGGEEFAAILPNTDETGALQVAERVRSAIEALALVHDGNAQCGSVVTVSVGCTTVRPTDDPRVAAALVAEADERLYEAKRTGRNRVASALPTSPVVEHGPGEAERLAVLAAYREAGACERSESLDQIAQLTARLFDVPQAFVSLVGGEEVTLVGRHNMDIDCVPREASYCAHTIEGSGPFVVPDTQADPRFAENPVTRAGIRFYAGAPIVSPFGGQNLGALCVVDDKARPPLDDAKRVLLTELAGLVGSSLERRRVASQAANEREPGPEQDAAVAA